MGGRELVSMIWWEGLILIEGRDWVVGGCGGLEALGLIGGWRRRGMMDVMS